MSSMNISYDKFNGVSEQYTTRRKSRKRILVTALASALIVAAVIFFAVGTNRRDRERDVDVGTNRLARWKSTSNAVKNACSSTLYPEFCVSSISDFDGLSSKAGPMDIANAAVRVSIASVEKLQAQTRSLSNPGLDFRQRGALQDCMEMFDNSLSELNDTLSDLQNTTFLSMPKHAADLETLLSGAMTNQYTCLEGFALTKGRLKQDLKGGVNNVSHLVSNSLAMVGNISAQANRALGIADSHHGRRRRLLSEEFMSSDEEGFPTWMSAGDRRLLQAPASNITANSVVAKDGSGDHTTISAAVDAAPEKNETRYIIYIKKGVYQENVEVPKNKHNLMFIGDGKGATVVTASRNVQDGYTTFHSATVAVTGKAFVARGITFENTAGPAKHQAVALRVGSDLSAFYQCSFKGYQDTLYVHSLRQFYRECDVYGTVDFIFGNAAAVLQNCNLYARKPLEKQKILYTAQGRKDPNQNTGISIQNCRVAADSDLAAVKSSFQVYLGRPWKEYSRTVFMQSFLDDLIQPAGWLEWNETFALSTLYYGEYMNRGPGAGTANRVKWPGYHVITSPAVANQFTVRQFIEGDSWLPATGVAYVSGLTSG